MNWVRLVSAAVLLTSIAFNASRVDAQVPSVTVFYVNGIQNTLADAHATSLDIRAALMSSPRNSGAGRKTFIVESKYNPIGWNEEEEGSFNQDLSELFVLKAAEEIYLPDLMSITLPHDADAQIDRDAASRVVAHLLDMTPGVTSLEEQGAKPLVDDERMSRTQQATLGLARDIRQRNGVVVVAHSQGNLIANLAWASLAAEFGNRVGQVARVVNVANTSAAAVNGLNLTHEGDGALFSNGLISVNPSLEALPTTKHWTRSTPHTESCGHPACALVVARPTFQRPRPAINYPSCTSSNWPFSPFDCASQWVEAWLLRHSMKHTYLNAQADIAIEVDPETGPRGVDFSGEGRLVDRFVDLVFAAAQALDRPSPPEPPIANRQPAISQGGQPTSVSAIVGTVARFAVIATGESPLRYQWRRNAIDVSCSSVQDCSSLDWPVAAADNGARFDVVVSNSTGSVTSNAATLNVVTESVESPNLAVASASFGPASVVPMGGVSVNFAVINDGEIGASASTAVIRITRSNLSAADPVVSVDVPVPILGSSSSVALPVATVSAPATPGTYYVWVVLDNLRTSGQLPADEADDIVPVPGTLTVTEPANGGPDLIIQSFTHGFGGNAVPPGGKLPVSFIVANTGAESAAASKVVLRINSSASLPEGNDLVVVDVPALAAGAAVARSATIRIDLVAGSYRVWAVADSTGTAGQVGAARGNDLALASGTLTVATAAQEAVDLVATDLKYEPPRVTQGGLAVITFTIRNQGTVASRSSRAVVRLNSVGAGADGLDRASVLVSELLPGATRIFTVAVPAAVETGAYQVWVEADASGSAGQVTTAAFANDAVSASSELLVSQRLIPPGATAEGAYGGAITGSTATAFRLLVLENGEFWALYGRPSGGRFTVYGFMQGTSTSANGSFSSTDLRDFGFAPSARGSATASYDSAQGTISGTFTTTRGTATLTGGVMTDVAYEYHQAASLKDVQGPWGLFTNTGDSGVSDIQADGRFETTTKGGCRLSGTMAPRASGKNVFDVVVSFGASPCALPDQTTRGIAVVNVEPDGRRQLTIGTVDAARSVGLTAAGYR
jgi:hypothetical protein